MTKLQKLTDKFFNNPQSLKFKDIKLVLLSLGFEHIDAKGSHVKFKHPKLINDIVLPIHNGDCKEFYKKQACKIVRENNI